MYLNGMPYISFTIEIYGNYILGKHHKESAPKKSVLRTSQQNQQIHINLCGTFHYYKNMVFALLASCLKWLYSQYLEYTSSLKWLNVSIMTKMKSSNVCYD
jgi:hypothetical protein